MINTKKIGILCVGWEEGGVDLELNGIDLVPNQSENFKLNLIWVYLISRRIINYIINQLYIVIYFFFLGEKKKLSLFHLSFPLDRRNLI